MRPTTLSTIACCALLGGSSASAQRIEQRFLAPLHAPLIVAPDSSHPMADSLRLRALRQPHRDSSWWVPLASTVLPGTGQALLGQDRFIAYLAVEGFVILDYFKFSAQEQSERTRSLALALDVARSLFPGPHPVGSWPYYESMERYIESGVFNRAPGGEVSPEVDPVTYNGWLWLDVRRRYWDNPNVEPAHTSQPYRDALNEYIARAVRDEMRWSWRNAQLEQDIYRRSIHQKNQAAQSATSLLNALAVNHLLSTLDAFITLRLRGGAGADGAPTSLSMTIPWAPFGRTTRR
jgi:hypothetical protein